MTAHGPQRGSPGDRLTDLYVIFVVLLSGTRHLCLGLQDVNRSIPKDIIITVRATGSRT